MSTTVAGWTVLELHSSTRPVSETRTKLLKGGVPKGTVSKIVTVLNALRDGRITPEQVTSLNRAYCLVKTNSPSLKRIIAGLDNLSYGELHVLQAHLTHLLEGSNQ